MMDAAGVAATPVVADREPMTEVGKWRATYASGDWLVLCGPASVVVVEPPGEGWTPLVAELWEQVLASSSLVDLAARLATYGLDTMPSFGALFWGADGMRSLVRGSVTVLDPATGAVVADGAGIQTWSEVGLGDLRTVRIETASGTAVDQLQLPLVVGAVRASSVVLDAREQARLHSPQLESQQPVDEEPAEPFEPTEPTDPFGDDPTPAGPSPSAAGEPVEGEPTELLTEPATEPESELAGPSTAQLELENADTALVALPVLPPGAPVPPATDGPTVDAVVCPHGHANPPGTSRCHDCGVRIADQRPRPVAQPVLALLRGTDGNEARLDRTVLIGRAPASRSGDPVRLLTVPSPSHDISRTHLQVVPDGWRIQVTDLHSTNGTVLITARGERRLLPPGEPVPAELGSVLELADGVSVVIDHPQ
jgi:FHA domain-containing protein